MTTRSKTLKERGEFKYEINKALYKSSDIVELLLGDTSGKTKSEILQEFKNHVHSHLFIDDTVTKAETFIYYDVRFPSLREHVKSCQVVMYLICERTILDTYSKDGYVGNRIDILSGMVEDALINDEEIANSFGIGKLNIDSLDIYNATRFYGCLLTFSVPNFR